MNVCLTLRSDEKSKTHSSRFSLFYNVLNATLAMRVLIYFIYHKRHSRTRACQIEQNVRLLEGGH